MTENSNMAGRKLWSLLMLLFSLELSAQKEPAALPGDATKMEQTKSDEKLKIEIWSDIVCPFCYIGKRKLDRALEKFPHKDQIEVIWKSFQLDPDAPHSGVDYFKDLSDRKGWSLEQTKQITSNVARMAAENGLEYHFEKAISVNSYDAHRFLHLAKQFGKQQEAEEALFKAHFTDGLNVADSTVLISLGKQIGLPEAEITKVLASNRFAEEVDHDISEARYLGVSGVPFFVLDRKFAISGAQDDSIFDKSLERAYEAWLAEKH